MSRAFAAIFVFVAGQACLIANVLGADAGQRGVEDPAEHSAFVQALKISDPEQKGAAMMQFVATYPQSVEKADALEQAMQAYQDARDGAKIEAAANQLIIIKPDSLRALAVLVVLERAQATKGDVSELVPMRAHIEHGQAVLVSR